MDRVISVLSLFLLIFVTYTQAQSCSDISLGGRAISELNVDAGVPLMYMANALYPVTENQTVNKPILAEAGAQFSISAGSTLTLEVQPDHPLTTFFSGAGNVVFKSGVHRIFPEWFGAKADGTTDDSAAIMKAYNAVKGSGNALIHFSSNTYGIGKASRLQFGNEVSFTAATGAKLLAVGGNTAGITILAGVQPHKNSFPILQGFSDYCFRLLGADITAIQLQNLISCGDAIRLETQKTMGEDASQILDSTIWFDRIENSKVGVSFIAGPGCNGANCIFQGNQIVGNAIVGGEHAIKYYYNGSAGDVPAWDSNQVNIGGIAPPASGGYAMVHAAPLSNRMVLKIGNVYKLPPGGKLFTGQHNLGNYVINLAAPLEEGQLGLYGELNAIQLTGKVTPVTPAITCTSNSNTKSKFNGGRSLVGNYHALKAPAETDWPEGETRSFFFYHQLATRWLYQVKFGGPKGSNNNGNYYVSAVRVQDNSVDGPKVMNEVEVWLVNTSGRMLGAGESLEFSVSVGTLGDAPAAV